MLLTKTTKGFVNKGEVGGAEMSKLWVIGDNSGKTVFRGKKAVAKVGGHFNQGFVTKVIRPSLPTSFGCPLGELFVIATSHVGPPVLLLQPIAHSNV
ncbi:Uncharacterized protein TCM_008738 [Theobroma cacao]|uniref:Uncharacterized protein n=1 Tax=Theobroma cacao TaxID=3641 RepID=A0A061E4B1_THECC|nr:Uncharacterized protein TCM_008738 [Theobroma cacao]